MTAQKTSLDIAGAAHVPFSATASTLYVQGTLGGDVANVMFSELYGGGGGDFISLLDSGGVYSFHVDSGFAGQARCANGGALAAGAAFKMAGAATANDFNMSFNGGIGTNDNAGSMPGSITKLQVAASGGASNQMGGIISKLVYLPRRMSNTELQTLTT